jgi:Ca2+-binding EF-hand superfamily protein
VVVGRLTLQVRKSFEELDKDGDGFITAEDLVKVSSSQASQPSSGICQTT